MKGGFLAIKAPAPTTLSLLWPWHAQLQGPEQRAPQSLPQCPQALLPTRLGGRGPGTKGRSLIPKPGYQVPYSKPRMVTATW